MPKLRVGVYKKVEFGPFKCPFRFSAGITTKGLVTLLGIEILYVVSLVVFDGHLIDPCITKCSVNFNFTLTFTNIPQSWWDNTSVKHCLSITAIVKSTQPPLDGFHCLDDSYSLLRNISVVVQTQAGCVRECVLIEECTVLMYNPWEAVCVLGSQTCAVTEPHCQLMAMVFSKEKNLECLVPMPFSELDSGSRLITIGRRKSMARLRGRNIYVGSSKTPGGSDLGFFGLITNRSLKHQTMFSWRCLHGAVWPGCHTQLEIQSLSVPLWVGYGMDCQLTHWGENSKMARTSFPCTLFGIVRHHNSIMNFRYSFAGFYKSNHEQFWTVMGYDIQ